MSDVDIKRRYEARQAAMFDETLTFGARILYWYLDDLANFRAFAWPSQATIAEKFSVSPRQVKRWYAELVGRHVSVKRGYKTSATTTLLWNEGTKMSPDRPTRGQKRPIEGTKMSPGYLIIDPVLIPTESIFACPNCKDEGLIQEPGEFRIDAPTCDCERGLAILNRRVNPRKRA